MIILSQKSHLNFWNRVEVYKPGLLWFCFENPDSWVNSWQSNCSYLVVGNEYKMFIKRVQIDNQYQSYSLQWLIKMIKMHLSGMPIVSLYTWNAFYSKKLVNNFGNDILRDAILSFVISKLKIDYKSQNYHQTVH